MIEEKLLPLDPVAPLGLRLRVSLVWARHHTLLANEFHYSAEVPVFSLWLVEEGTVHISSSEGELEVSKGEVYFGPPTHKRHITAKTDARWLSAGLSVATPTGVSLLSGLPTGSRTVPQEAAGRLRALLLLLNDMGQWPAEPGELAREGITRALAAWLWKDLGGAGRVGPELPGWLQKSLHLMQKEPGISVEKLAHEAHFSPAQFRRLFHRHLGQVPGQYMAGQRLQLARGLLLDSDMSVEAVARAAGYGGTSQFSRDFKRQVGLGPLQFRRTSRQQL